VHSIRASYFGMLHISQIFHDTIINGTKVAPTSNFNGQQLILFTGKR
jgi:hypothetical protein